MLFVHSRFIPSASMMPASFKTEPMFSLLLEFAISFIEAYQECSREVLFYLR